MGFAVVAVVKGSSCPGGCVCWGGDLVSLVVSEAPIGGSSRTNSHPAHVMMRGNHRCRHGVGGCSGRCASGTWLLLRYCCCASMPPMLRLLLLLLLAKETSALDNGLGLLPPQAWRSWNVRATLIRHDSNRWPARLLVPLVRHIRGSRSTARVRGNSRPIVSHGTHRCCSHAGIPRELQPVHDPRHDRRAGGQEPHGGREADEPQGSGLRHDRNR
jgi:hypothetical protein